MLTRQRAAALMPDVRRRGQGVLCYGARAARAPVMSMAASFKLCDLKKSGLQWAQGGAASRSQLRENFQARRDAKHNRHMTQFHNAQTHLHARLSSSCTP